MQTLRLTVHAYATTVTAENGKFHPAVGDNVTYQIHYWPNITFVNEDEAVAWATAILTTVQDVVGTITNQWNTAKW